MVCLVGAGPRTPPGPAVGGRKKTNPIFPIPESTDVWVLKMLTPSKWGHEVIKRFFPLLGCGCACDLQTQQALGIQQPWIKKMIPIL